MYYFIYKTSNTINNKDYIGIHHTENLDDGYLGSGIALLKAIKKYGKENFQREIIKFCESFDELLEEEKFLVNEDWVKSKTNYNLKTGGQSNGILSKESKVKISKTLKDKYEKGELKARKVKPYEMDETHIKKISESLKKRYESIPHHSTGVEPWNKGKTGVQEAWNKGKVGVQEGWCKGMTLEPLAEDHKSKISNSLKQYYENNESPTKGIEAWNKGKTMKKIECPHCAKMVDIGNGKRWHFDNCKLKS